MHDDAMHSETRQDRDDLDPLLDAALATYADPAPAPGLTNRILASTTRLEHRPHPRRWMAWAVPALAALLLLAIFLSHRGIVRHKQSPVAASPAPSSPTPTAAVNPPTTH